MLLNKKAVAVTVFSWRLTLLQSVAREGSISKHTGSVMQSVVRKGRIMNLVCLHGTCEGREHACEDREQCSCKGREHCALGLFASKLRGKGAYLQDREQGSCKGREHHALGLFGWQ